MRHGIVVCAFVLVSGLLLGGDLEAGSLEPPGPPAPTMKTIQQVESRTPISSLPFTISAPGSYYLTGDLTGVAGQPGIIVSASHVTLDLNGFALIGGTGSLEGVQMPAGSLRHLEIRNGVVRNWGGRGVSALVNDVHVKDLRVDTNGSDGLMLGARAIVRDTSATGNTGNGISTGPSTTVTGCAAASNGASGIVVGLSAVVSNSTSASNGFNGIVLSTGSSAFHSAVRQNVVGFSGVDGNTIESCTADSNSEDGIRINARGFVRGNVLRANLNAGIHAIGNSNRIEANEANSNATGIRVDGINNLIIRNSVSINGTEYMVGPGNKLGPISIDPATAGPWANFDL